VDYPKSVPSIGLVNGKFVDEDTATGAPGSLIPAAWGNAVTDEIMALIAAAGLVPTEGNNTQLATAFLRQPGRLLGVQTFTANGTYTPTPGTATIVVEAVGGGGGGAGTTTTSSGLQAAGGGGGGAFYALGRFTIGATPLAVAIGPGGAGGSNGSNGAAGGVTSLGSLISAGGGYGAAVSIARAMDANTIYPGGRGGNTNSSPNVYGAVGCDGAAGLGLNGSLLSGQGGASGKGGAGASSVGQNTAGIAASNIGAGGSGGCASGAGALVSGGAGGRGVLIVYEYSGV
jgi:hypothetical protein